MFWINDPSRIFIARNGRHELTSLMLTTAQVQELTERMLKSSGRRVDISRPFIDAMLPEGHRRHVVPTNSEHDYVVPAGIDLTLAQLHAVDLEQGAHRRALEFLNLVVFFTNQKGLLKFLV